MIKYLIMIIKERKEMREKERRKNEIFANCELAKKGFGR